MSVLQRIVADVRAALAAQQAACPDVEQRAAAWCAENPRRELSAALRRPGEVALVAEFKRASPSRGPIRPDADPRATARIYAAAGARALSVLTEPAHFGGSLEDLVAAREATDLPVLRKDFILDPFQVHQAAAAGADGLLLMASVLDDERLAALHALAAGYSIDCLVEVGDAADIERVRPLRPPLVGINNRDLTTLRVDLSRSLELRAAVDWPAVVVAESGVSGPQDLAAIGAAGFDAALVGTALMAARDPAALLRGLVGAGRR